MNKYGKNSVKFEDLLYHKRQGFSEYSENAMLQAPIFKEKIGF